ncbi:hypothetical protein WJX84_009168 [Apatococcus fuscideae]|uniref:Uncharacterized protein n=1 Tax=Apatococcus fuscideae TaxID=2026836 RepID=A0AAW1RK72_9CHLO
MLDSFSEVEVNGRHTGGESDGLATGWLSGDVQSTCQSRHTYDVLLRGVDSRTKQPWAVLTLPAQNVRPIPMDDSLTVPLSERRIGDAVDCWDQGIWWSGYISETHHDRVFINFPCWPNYEDYTVQQDSLHQPGARLIRTSREWLPTDRRWEMIAPLRLPHYTNKRPPEMNLSQPANAQPKPTFESIMKLNRTAHHRVRWGSWAKDARHFCLELRIVNEWRICVFDLITAQRLLGHASFAWATVRPLKPSFEFTWSPAASHIVICADAQSDAERLEEESGVVALVEAHGPCEILKQACQIACSRATWSRCGRYLCVVSKGTPPLAAGEPGPFQPDHNTLSVSGFIWDTRSSQQVFGWAGGAGSLTENCVIWAAAACACYVESCSAVLTWPSPESSIPEVASLWPHLGSLGPNPAVLSPCGRVHIAVWSMPRSRAVYTMPTWQAHDVDSASIPRFYQLWHSVVRPGGGTASMHMAHASPWKWSLESIAWHPNPAAGCVYAIMSACGDLSVVDGLRHRVLRSWTWSQLSAKGHNSPGNQSSVKLSWSPDGSRLIIAASRETVALRFGGHCQPSDEMSSS